MSTVFRTKLPSRAANEPRTSPRNEKPRSPRDTDSSDSAHAANDGSVDDAPKSPRSNLMSKLQERTKTILNRVNSKQLGPQQRANSRTEDPEAEDLDVASDEFSEDVPPTTTEVPSPRPGPGADGSSPPTPGTTVVKKPLPPAPMAKPLERKSSGQASPPTMRNNAATSAVGRPASGMGLTRSNDGSAFRESPVVTRGPSLSVASATEAGRVATERGTTDDGRGYNLHAELRLPQGFVNPFGAEDTDDCIIFQPAAPAASGSDIVEQPKIKGGTLVKLVERLTYQEHGDPDYVKMFLLTYRSFTTPVELMSLLIARFLCPLPPADGDEERLELRRTFQKPIRLRVFAVLKLWITQSSDFVDEKDEIVPMLTAFCREQMELVMPPGARQLLTLLERALSRDELTKKRTPISAKDIPRPVLPTCRPSELSLLTIAPIELARQLTLMEAEYFNAIKPWELLNLAWSRKGKEEKAPNVLAMIGRANTLSPWIGMQIVACKSMKQRVELVTRCIQTMTCLEELHNFNGIMEFLAALQNAGVGRLKETWARLDKKSTRAYDMLNGRMSRDNNFKIFRDSLRTVSPPSIPFLGLYLSDLTFIEEGNSNYLDEDCTMINIAKRAQYSQIIKDIVQNQQTPYLLQPVPMVMDFLRALPTYTTEAVYDASLQIKARDKDAREVDEGGGDLSGSNKKGKSDAANAAMAAAEPDWGEIAFPAEYPFAEPDTDDNIVVDDENHKSVMYSSKPKLVERLTFEKYSDQTFVSAVLLTHRLLMTSTELAELLIARYRVPLPVRDDADTRAKYDAKVVRPIRLRVFNALKQWVDKYPMDFDAKLLARLEAFAEEMKSTGMAKPAERIVEGLALVRAIGSGETKKPPGQTTPRQNVKSPPAIIFPTKVARIEDATVLDLSPLEIARQLTLVEFALYRQIGDRELLVWNPSEAAPNVDRATQCANVWAMEQHNEWLSQWAPAVVLSQTQQHSTARVLEHLIAVAEALRTLNNFNGCRCVVEGLTSASIMSLDAWVSLSPKSAKIFDALKDLMDDVRTYFKHQQWLQKVSVPALPSLRSCLVELKRIEMALPDRISEIMHPARLYNVEKKLRLAKVVTDCLVFQGTEFVLDKSPEIMALIEAVPRAPTDEKTLADLVERLNEDAGEDEASGEDVSLKARVTAKLKSVAGAQPSKQPTPGVVAVSRSKYNAGATVRASTAEDAPAFVSQSLPQPVLQPGLQLDRGSAAGMTATAPAPAPVLPVLLPMPTTVASASDGDSPNTSPRTVAGVSRATGSGAVTALPPRLPSRSKEGGAYIAADAVTREWVRELVTTAIAEAVAPLQEEIAALKRQLRAMQDRADGLDSED